MNWIERTGWVMFYIAAFAAIAFGAVGESWVLQAAFVGMFAWMAVGGAIIRAGQRRQMAALIEAAELRFWNGRELGRRMFGGMGEPTPVGRKRPPGGV